MKWVIMVLIMALCVMTVICYSLCVMAHEADERAERMYRKWKEKAMKLEDAIKRYESWAEDDRIDVLIRNEHRQIADWLKELKSRQADRKGEWIDAEIPLESGGSMPIQVCNLCKTFYPLAYTGGGHRFCPNCGAKMKGADDD